MEEILTVCFVADNNRPGQIVADTQQQTLTQTMKNGKRKTTTTAAAKK